LIADSEATLADRQTDLANKKSELEEIISDTQKEEEGLYNKSEQIQKLIEDRLLTAYKRIRTNARNGLAVVSVQRDACGGCFNQIPPQRQLDIKSRKKIIVCEYCGRILVDDEIIKESTGEIQ
jgi:predicted  nucleic acid-binding Zn-ribbon protein